MPLLTTAPIFQSKVPIQFICLDSPSLSLDGINNPTIFNNPSILYIQPGSVAKIDLGLNGVTYFSGDTEYAPFALEIGWDVLGMRDYVALAQLRPYFVHFISYRNVGYYGKLVLDGAKSVKSGGDMVSTKATLYVLNPSDVNGAVALKRANNPGSYSVVVQSGVTPGFQPMGIPQYYWMTFSTVYGETDPYFIGAVFQSSVNQCNTIMWQWPTDTGYIEKTSIYVSNTPNISNCKLMTEVFNGQTPIWNDLVGFAGVTITQQPPQLNTAYRGYWASGIWQNEA